MDRTLFLLLVASLLVSGRRVNSEVVGLSVPLPTENVIRVIGSEGTTSNSDVVVIRRSSLSGIGLAFSLRDRDGRWHSIDCDFKSFTGNGTVCGVTKSPTASYICIRNIETDGSATNRTLKIGSDGSCRLLPEIPALLKASMGLVRLVWLPTDKLTAVVRIYADDGDPFSMAMWRGPVEFYELRTGQSERWRVRRFGDTSHSIDLVPLSEGVGILSIISDGRKQKIQLMLADNENRRAVSSIKIPVTLKVISVAAFAGDILVLRCQEGKSGVYFLGDFSDGSICRINMPKSSIVHDVLITSAIELVSVLERRSGSGYQIVLARSSIPRLKSSGVVPIENSYSRVAKDAMPKFVRVSVVCDDVVVYWALAVGGI